MVVTLVVSFSTSYSRGQVSSAVDKCLGLGFQLTDMEYTFIKRIGLSQIANISQMVLIQWLKNKK